MGDVLMALRGGVSQAVGYVNKHLPEIGLATTVPILLASQMENVCHLGVYCLKTAAFYAGKQSIAATCEIVSLAPIPQPIIAGALFATGVAVGALANRKVTPVSQTT